MKYNALALALMSFGSFANWVNTDAILLDADTHEILSLLAEPVEINSPITAEIAHNDLIRMSSPTEALKRIDVYYSGEACTGSSFIVPPPTVHSDKITVLGTTYEESYPSSFGLVEVRGNDVFERNYQSYRSANTNDCIAEASSMPSVEAGIESLEYYNQLTIEPTTGIANFGNTLNYATAEKSEKPYPTQSSELHVYISPIGEVKHVINKTPYPLYFEDITVNHADAHRYDINLPDKIMPANHDFKKVITQCSVNLPISAEAANYTIGCFKVNGQNIIRVITRDASGESPEEATIAVSVYW